MLHFVLGYKSRFHHANGKFCGPGYDLLQSLTDLPFTSSLVGEPIPETATKVVLAGAGAWQAYSKAERHVGVVFNGPPGQQFICSWHPQDAADVVDIESMFAEEDADEFDGAEGASKDAAPTQRVNYRFWLKSHIHKLIHSNWEPSEPFTYYTYTLASLKLPIQSTYLYLDIETHPQTDTLQCLSIAFDKGPVYSQTIYNYQGLLQPNAVESMVWLARAMRMHTVVIHNALFDLPFLAMMHSIPWGNAVHDTMAMFHRLFPEADKSLAHVIQYFTNEQYHKDESGTFNPHNQAQQEKLLRYNAKDVHTLRLVHRGLLKHYNESMKQVNESILDYAYAGLHGFYLDYEKRQRHQVELENKLKQLKRIFAILVGNATINPNSGQQIARWLHTLQPEGLGYKVYDRTAAGDPATDATALYKALAAHENNVALIVLLQIKETAKKISMLEFEPYTQPANR